MWHMFVVLVTICSIDTDGLADSCSVNRSHYETLLQSIVVRSLHHTLASKQWHLHK